MTARRSRWTRWLICDGCWSASWAATQTRTDHGESHFVAKRSVSSPSAVTLGNVVISTTSGRSGTRTPVVFFVWRLRKATGGSGERRVQPPASKSQCRDAALDNPIAADLASHARARSKRPAWSRSQINHGLRGPNNRRSYRPQRRAARTTHSRHLVRVAPRGWPELQGRDPCDNARFGPVILCGGVGGRGQRRWPGFGVAGGWLAVSPRLRAGWRA